jgi:hypothetical protein
MQQELYRICWQSRFTDYKGQGRPLPRAIAEAQCERMNNAYPDIWHWITPETRIACEADNGAA